MSQAQNLLPRLKLNLRENSSPFFSDEELTYLLEDAGYDLEQATYNGLLRKAEDDSIGISGISVPNNGAYWLRIAKQYRKNQGGCVKRG